MDHDHHSAYRPASVLVTSITVFMIMNLGTLLVAIWSGSLEIELLTAAKAGAAVSEDQAFGSDRRQAVIGLVQLAIYVSLVVLYSVWVYRANRNARALGARDMTFSPGWCVGWFFVPIMNLFKPYQAVKEIWKASNPSTAGSWQQGESPGLVTLWWALWIIWCVLGNASFRLSLRAEGLDQLLVCSWLTMICDVIDVPLTILALLVVRTIHDMQQRMHATGPGQAMPAPAPPAVSPHEGMRRL